MGSLSDIRVRNARPRDRAYKLFDERGLFLLVMPSGGRLWRLKYRMYGREKLISLGAYPDVALSRAREKRDEARKLIVEGIDPSAERQERKTALPDTFEGVAEEWLTLQSKSLAPETISILGGRLHRPVSVPGQSADFNYYRARATRRAASNRGAWQARDRASGPSPDRPSHALCSDNRPSTTRCCC